MSFHSRNAEYMYQLIREEVGQRESVAVKFVETKHQTSDVLAKPAPRATFERHARRLLGKEWLFEEDAKADRENI